MTKETRCVPLCGADRAAGIPVDWWMHEALCPARKARKPVRDGGYRHEDYAVLSTPENMEEP